MIYALQQAEREKCEKAAPTDRVLKELEENVWHAAGYVLENLVSAMERRAHALGLHKDAGRLGTEWASAALAESVRVMNLRLAGKDTGIPWDYSTDKDAKEYFVDYVMKTAFRFKAAEKELRKLTEYRDPGLGSDWSNPPKGYGLYLMSVDTNDGIVNKGRSLVVVALLGTKLHIRIFDASGKKVVDKAENELNVGEALKALKLQLNPMLENASLTEEDKQEIISNAISSAGHTTARDTVKALSSVVVSRNIARAVSGGHRDNVATEYYSDTADGVESVLKHADDTRDAETVERCKALLSTLSPRQFFSFHMHSLLPVAEFSKIAVEVIAIDAGFHERKVKLIVKRVRANVVNNVASKGRVTQEHIARLLDVANTTVGQALAEVTEKFHKEFLPDPESELG